MTTLATSWTSIILTTCYLIAITTAFTCKDLQSCTCSDMRTHHVMECPSIAQQQATVSLYPDTLEIKCLRNDLISNVESHFLTFDRTDPAKDLNFLPSFNVSVANLCLEDCPLPNTTFTPTIKRMHLEGITSLNIKRSSFENVAHTVQYFENFAGNLTELTIQRGEIVLKNGDILSNMKNLRKLNLNSNNIQDINNQFETLKNLRSLDLSENRINRITGAAFKSLTQLELLHLWSNKLVSLPEDAFDGLQSLKWLELMRNELVELPENIFSKLTNLLTVNIGTNQLTTIPIGLFTNNQLLQSVRIERIKLLQELPNGFFADFPDLVNISLNYCGLKSLPVDLFRNSSRIRKILLEYNQLETIPEDIFKGLNSLEILLLNNNKLSHISDSIFSGLFQLDRLSLAGNALTQEISPALFANSSELRVLAMQNNRIREVHIFAFQNNEKLEELDLSRNLLDFAWFSEHDSSPLNRCVKLRVLNLSHNFITTIISDFTQTKPQLKVLDLSYNNISRVEFANFVSLSLHKLELNLSNNNISEIDLSRAEFFVDPDSRFVTCVDLNNNPLNCDCRVFDLLRYYNLSMDPQVRNMVDIKSDELRCAGPPGFALKLAEELKPHMVTCGVQQCPDGCSCYERPFNRAYLVDCIDRRLRKVPTIVTPNNTARFMQAEVFLQGNLIRQGPVVGMGYGNVSLLDLSRNLVEEFTWVPGNLKVLNLNNNQLRRLKDSVLTDFKSLTSIVLDHNPWTCDCLSLNFSNYIKEASNVKDKVNIRCNETTQPLHLLSQPDLCPTHAFLYITLVLVCITAVAIVAITLAIYKFNNQKIKVWLFAHNMCLWFVKEDDLDKDKLYDAFLSYSHVDETFVVDELVSKLEGGDNPYRLCIHTRNWIPGEFIATQVIDSVKTSRRTIVVLSPTFLQSVWGTMEFREAHTQALSEGRSRVIVILYGDIDPNADLGEEMNAYLKTNTYIKWGDPWFWDRLRYAMPHNQRKFGTQNKKLEIISANLDKLDLINGNLTPNHMSTPPAHPLLIKNNPLDFKITPPAESGQIEQIV